MSARVLVAGVGNVFFGDDGFGAARDSRAAIEQVRPIVLDLCERTTDDLESYERRARLLEKHVELRARNALKTQEIATRLAAVLRDRGTEETIALFAAQIALACYEIATRRAATAADLVQETDAAFAEVLSLGRD